MKFKEHREAYSYPFVALTGTIGQHSCVEFNTSSKLDAYHHQLLRSPQDEQSVLGYLSVLYWGHYATSNGIANHNRALSKVQTAINGSSFIRKGVNIRRRGLVDLPPHQAVQLIREAITLVDSARYGEAIRVLCTLPQVKFAFASKIVAFISPSTCGVIDSVIAKKNPEFGFKLSGKYVSAVLENFQNYERYCALLLEKAEALNEFGPAAHWVDRDGQSHPWRVLDVERAFYGR